MKTSYLMRDFPIGLGALDLTSLCAIPTLTEPSRLEVDFDYSAPRAAVLTLPNGDPGDEPPEQEDLAIYRIASAIPLHFADNERGVLVTLAAGRDLRDYLTDAALTVIELAVLNEVRNAPGEARLEAHLESLA